MRAGRGRVGRPGAAALAAAHVDDVSNIKALSPGVSFTTNYNPAVGSNIQVRGVGTVGNNRIFEGAVGVFVEGLYRTRAGQALENFLDVDSLQVLSGPQGTPFGKNTSTGAVLMTSAAADGDRSNRQQRYTQGD